MSKKSHIYNLFKKKIVILDGAVGTLLQQQGMPAGKSPELWSLEHKDVLQHIHEEYINAGSDMIYTCTFGANRIKLKEYGEQKTREINVQLARAARKAAGRRVLVAGDIGPTGQFIEPFGTLPFEEAINIYKEQIKALAEGGVDLFVIETMIDIQEARAALIALRETTDAFTIVTMTYEKDGRTLNGTDPVTALITLQSLGADAVGCNCSTGPDDMLHCITDMKPYATVPLIAKPNAGIPRLVKKQTVYEMQPKEFAAFAREFAAKGVNGIGGCCGTTPRHIAELRKKLQHKKPAAPIRASIGAVSSAHRNIIFDPGRPCIVVGERINPTGKSQLQQELRQGQHSLVREMAKEQENSGADMLDVNVGMPETDERKTMLQVVSLLAGTTALPLIIDSADPAVIESALRVYPGRAVVNSISGETHKLKKLLPIAAKYGAMFILLPLRDKELPETVIRRKEIIQSVFKQAQRCGFSKDDIIVDALCMTVSAHPQAAIETLKTIEWCSEVFECRTGLGLSNISFGMPQRTWVNASFLAMAITKGLTMAIANSCSKELMHIKMAIDVLTGKDKDATAFISFFSKNIKKEKMSRDEQNLSPSQKIYSAIIEGNRQDIVRIVEQVLKSGLAASKIVQEHMIPAIKKVGDLYDRKEYFLPQLIASAETMKKAMTYLEPYLAQQHPDEHKKARILIATVEGDIHDIGKNIVGLILKNHGFDVIDLGKDVSVEKIASAIQHYHPRVVGLSALMTTTMVNMKETIDTCRQKGYQGSFIVGGAVVTQGYAQSLGAEFARDGVEAVRVLEKLTT